MKVIELLGGVHSTEDAHLVVELQDVELHHALDEYCVLVEGQLGVKVPEPTIESAAIEVAESMVHDRWRPAVTVSESGVERPLTVEEENLLDDLVNRELVD